MALFLLGCVDEGNVIDPTPLGGTMGVEYPIDLWDKDVEGSSLLRLRINQEGAVDSVSILESSGYSAFDSSAVRAAKEMRFNVRQFVYLKMPLAWLCLQANSIGVVKWS